jgi:hypothetical protein
LTKMTAYGVAIPGGAGAVVAGTWAPVTMQTRMNNLAIAGPVMDTNWVFDSINTAATAKTYTVTQKAFVKTGETAKTAVGTKQMIEFGFAFTNFAAGYVLKAPYNLNMKFAAQPDRAAGTDTAVQLYPHDYDEWVWTAKCTNTQFGIDDADTTDKVGPVTLKTTAVACAVDKTSGALVLTMTEDLAAATPADWSTFKMKFNIEITHPSDRHTSTTTVSTWLSDPNSNQVWGTGDLAGVFGPTKPTGQADTQSAGLVSFGKNPNDATMITQGVGVYSTNFCLIVGNGVTGTLDDHVISNCGI